VLEKICVPSACCADLSGDLSTDLSAEALAEAEALAKVGPAKSRLVKVRPACPEKKKIVYFSNEAATKCLSVTLLTAK